MPALAPMAWRRSCWDPIANTQPHKEASLKMSDTNGLISITLILQSGSLDTRMGTNPSSAAFNNIVLSDVHQLNWRIYLKVTGSPDASDSRVDLPASRAT
jgi:hypothetical protein